MPSVCYLARKYIDSPRLPVAQSYKCYSYGSITPPTRKPSPITMLSIFFLMLAAIAASASNNGTYIIANPITGADSAEQCRTGVGIPGAFYWCKERNFGNDDHCDYWYPNKACWYMKSPENIRRSIAPDFGGYCKCM
jgi:hypothetical protein